ncbi:MAG: DUF3253 domain-containing protein [Alphaproteobacteria bacterium]
MSRPDQQPPKRRNVSDAAIEAEILALAGACAAGGSIAPNDAARALAPEQWQALMGRVRLAAVRLAKAGRIEILRKGRPADPEAFKGVYRLRLAAPSPAGAAGDRADG